MKKRHRLTWKDGNRYGWTKNVIQLYDGNLENYLRGIIGKIEDEGCRFSDVVEYCQFGKLARCMSLIDWFNLYSRKGDKERIAQAKAEMKKAYGIQIAPCRFRQDNRDYYIDRAGNAISDALASVKHITARVANALYAMRDNFYVCFTDLLYELEMNPAFNATSIAILIQMGYFDAFGGNKKLLVLYDAFRNGDNRFSKEHVVKTQQARLEALRQLEA